MRSDWRDKALSAMAAMLFTGLVSWMAFGNEAATKEELKDHSIAEASARKEHIAKPAHADQIAWNAGVKAELEAIREAQREMPERFAEIIRRELDRRGVGRP